MVSADADRIESERAFHNKRFSGAPDSREPLNRWYAAVSFGRQRMQRLISQWAPNAAVLEYGVAEGGDMAFHLEMARTVSSYQGIDISDEAVRHISAKARALQLGNFSFAVMNAEELTFPDKTFDLVYGTGILHHLDLDRALSEMSRVMRPGGQAVFFEPMGHNPFLNAFRNRTPHLRTADEHPFLVSDFAKAQQRFSKVEIEYFGLTTLLAVPFQRWSVGPLVMKACEATDAALNRLPSLGKYAWHAVMIFRK